MAFSKVVVSVAAIGLFGVAIAQDQTRVQIEVISDDTDHEAVRIELDSDNMGFNLHDMQEGREPLDRRQGRSHDSRHTQTQTGIHSM